MSDRRKIMDEAEQPEDNNTEREQLTQRMPPTLIDRVDEVADKLGMSRNACINMLVEQGLNNW
jgi:hypothetical protein